LTPLQLPLTAHFAGKVPAQKNPREATPQLARSPTGTLGQLFVKAPAAVRTRRPAATLRKQALYRQLIGAPQ
jgi:hypothetical protein